MELNSIIDFTLLKPETTENDIHAFCMLARKYNFYACAVTSVHVAQVVRELKNTGIKVCCAVGFPLGAMLSSVKAYEAKCALDAGADEIDMVIQIGALKSGQEDKVLQELIQVRDITKNHIFKVILENCLLNKEEIIRGCQLAVEAGADYVKTSTGFLGKGACEEDIRLMKETVNGKALVKASGGIKTLDQAMKLVEAGASRLGISSAVEIMNEYAHRRNQ
uniref:deoxyribose-phosphate aldolase n=1 Tax=Ndongobacter massiliensis TaxID=1871025 RepID=UPI0009307814|nr:deoxyribose-phosphate aldolase [Ndongobacter massiliensis]